jgi:hypothetical protein
MTRTRWRTVSFNGWRPAAIAVAGLLATSVAPTASAVVTAIRFDFNGDGHADLAVGVPGEAVGGLGGAGAVNVIYGTATVLKPAGNQLWTQDSPGIKGVPHGGAYGRGDGLGSALASADFNGDGYADLAIGAPRDRVGADLARGGAVNVLYGSATGLRAAGNQLLLAPMDWVPSDDDYGPLFGIALGVGDLDGDGCDDIGIGAPNAGRRDGVVVVAYGSPAGAGVGRMEPWSQDTPGVPGSAERGDRFGSAVAITDIGRSGRADLVIGADGEDQGAGAACRVTILFGRTGGVTATGPQVWFQDSPGILDRGEHDDHFGSALGG